MANGLPQKTNNGYIFPPEADADFEYVEEHEIATLRKEMAEKHGLGNGKLRVIEEPVAFD